MLRSEFEGFAVYVSGVCVPVFSGHGLKSKSPVIAAESSMAKYVAAETLCRCLLSKEQGYGLQSQRPSHTNATSLAGD